MRLHGGHDDTRAALGGAQLVGGRGRVPATVLLFDTPNDFPDRNRRPDSTIPAELIAAFEAIASSVPGHNYGGNLANMANQAEAGGMVGSVPLNAYIVPETPEATALLDRLGDDELAAKRRCKRDDPALAVVGRGWEYIVKTAMIRAIGRCPSKPVITETDVAWAAKLVRHCQSSLLAGIEEHVADSEAEETYKKLLNVIRVHGPISGDKLAQLVRMDPKVRASYLAALVEEGTVIRAAANAKGPGVKGSVYSLAKKRTD